MAILNKVMSKDEEVTKLVDKKVSMLRREINTLRGLGSVKVGEKKPTDLRRKCVRCRKQFGLWRKVVPIADRGMRCQRCKFNVCKQCRHKQANGLWMCCLCVRYREIQYLTGEWISAQITSNLSGTELLRVSFQDREYYMQMWREHKSSAEEAKAGKVKHGASRKKSKSSKHKHKKDKSKKGKGDKHKGKKGEKDAKKSKKDKKDKKKKDKKGKDKKEKDKKGKDKKGKKGKDKKEKGKGDKGKKKDKSKNAISVKNSNMSHASVEDTTEEEACSSEDTDANSEDTTSIHEVVTHHVPVAQERTHIHRHMEMHRSRRHLRHSVHNFGYYDRHRDTTSAQNHEHGAQGDECSSGIHLKKKSESNISEEFHIVPPCEITVMGCGDHQHSWSSLFELERMKNSHNMQERVSNKHHINRKRRHIHSKFRIDYLLNENSDVRNLNRYRMRKREKHMVRLTDYSESCSHLFGNTTGEQLIQQKTWTTDGLALNIPKISSHNHARRSLRIDTGKLYEEDPTGISGEIQTAPSEHCISKHLSMVQHKPKADKDGINWTKYLYYNMKSETDICDTCGIFDYENSVHKRPNDNDKQYNTAVRTDELINKFETVDGSRSETHLKSSYYSSRVALSSLDSSTVDQTAAFSIDEDGTNHSTTDDFLGADYVSRNVNEEENKMLVAPKSGGFLRRMRQLFANINTSASFGVRKLSRRLDVNENYQVNKATKLTRPGGLVEASPTLSNVQPKQPKRTARRKSLHFQGDKNRLVPEPRKHGSSFADIMAQSLLEAKKHEELSRQVKVIEKATRASQTEKRKRNVFASVFCPFCRFSIEYGLE